MGQQRRRAGTGLALGFAAFIIATAGSARLLNQAAQTNLPQVQTVEGPEIYAGYAHADEMLRQGNADAAGQILDRLRPESLVVESGAMGEGALASFSPSTVLIHVIKNIGNQAILTAKAGDAPKARQWLLRGWRIGDQVIATPRPSADALNVAHLADCHLSQVQSQVAHLCGDAEAEKTARLRGTRLMQVWRNQVVPELHPNRTGRLDTDHEDTARLRSLCNRYSVYRMQAGAGAWANQV